MNREKRPTMVDRVTNYLEHRRALGFELKSAGLVLLDFARFADRSGYCGPLTVDFIMRWPTMRTRTPRGTAPSDFQSFASSLTIAQQETGKPKCLGSGCWNSDNAANNPIYSPSPNCVSCSKRELAWRHPIPFADIPSPRCLDFWHPPVCVFPKLSRSRAVISISTPACCK